MKLPTDAKERKEIPVTTGVLDYFPLAMIEVAKLSMAGSRQHHPGEPLHWDKTKSTDHADCIVRHLLDRGTVDTDKVRHSTKVAWRALALLETELEAAARDAKLLARATDTGLMAQGEAMKLTMSVPPSWCDLLPLVRGPNAPVNPWINWRGGDCCPHSDDTRVDVKMRNGSAAQNCYVGQLGWAHFGKGDDIVEYRVLKAGKTATTDAVVERRKGERRKGERRKRAAKKETSCFGIKYGPGGIITDVYPAVMDRRKADRRAATIVEPTQDYGSGNH